MISIDMIAADIKFSVYLLAISFVFSLAFFDLILSFKRRFYYLLTLYFIFMSIFLSGFIFCLILYVQRIAYV